jgi:hypothetical protein
MEDFMLDLVAADVRRQSLGPLPTSSALLGRFRAQFLPMPQAQPPASAIAPAAPQLALPIAGPPEAPGRDEPTAAVNALLLAQVTASLRAFGAKSAEPKPNASTGKENAPAATPNREATLRQAFARPGAPRNAHGGTGESGRAEGKAPPKAPPKAKAIAGKAKAKAGAHAKAKGKAKAGAPAQPTASAGKPAMVNAGPPPPPLEYKPKAFNDARLNFERETKDALAKAHPNLKPKDLLAEAREQWKASQLRADLIATMPEAEKKRRRFIG